MLAADRRCDTRVLRADAPGAIQEAAATLRRGELVVFPTDTVYGVGGAYGNIEAIRRLYWAKQRPYELATPHPDLPSRPCEPGGPFAARGL